MHPPPVLNLTAEQRQPRHPIRHLNAAFLRVPNPAKDGFALSTDLGEG